MKVIGRTLRALGFHPDRHEIVAHDDPAEVPANVGVIMLNAVRTPDDLAEAMDACIRAYLEGLDIADISTHMGIIEALDSIKRRIFRTLLTREGDPR